MPSTTSTCSIRSAAALSALSIFATCADATFWDALRNTLLWTVVSVVLQFLLGLVLALLLNQPFPGRGLVQALVFLPWAVPSFLSGLNWAWLFNPVVGPLPHWFRRSA